MSGVPCNGAGGRVGFEINAYRAGPLMRVVMSKEQMARNLKKERTAFADWIRDAVASYDTKRTPKKITRIDIVFDIDSSKHPLVWIELDTSPKGEPGSSSGFEIARKECTDWKHGTDYTPVGEFFVEIIKSLRDEGAFNSLPRAASCYLGVSTHDGEYGWPNYDDRGPENMI